MSYLTPERFRTMGTGSDLSGIENWELRSILEAASRLADAYCSVPQLPVQFDFRGGTVTNEEHEWNPGERRVYFGFRPVRAITSFQAFASNTVFLTVAPDQIFVNKAAGWGEIVATQYSLAGSNFPMMPFWGLGIPIVRVSYTYGWQFPVTGEFLEPTDAWTYRALNQFWLDLPDIAVYVNGTLSNPTDYSLDRVEGTVTFNTGLAPDDAVTADYTYPLPYNIPRAVALIASNSVSERDLIAKGMGVLSSIQVEEVHLSRARRGGGSAGQIAVETSSIPDSAKVLLDGYRFITVR